MRLRSSEGSRRRGDWVEFWSYFRLISLVSVSAVGIYQHGQADERVWLFSALQWKRAKFDASLLLNLLPLCFGHGLI